MDQFTFKRPQDDFSLQVPLSVIKSRLVTCFVKPFSLGFRCLVKLVVVLSVVMVAACDTTPTVDNKPTTETGTKWTSETGQDKKEEPPIIVVSPTAQNIIDLVNHSNELRMLQRYEEALQNCDKAIELISKFVDRNGNSVEATLWRAVALINRGVALIGLKRYEEALESYDKAIAIDPDKYAEAWNGRGTALATNLKRQEEALKSFNEAIKIKPDHAEAWNNKGNVLGNLKRYQESLESCDQAIKIKPDYAEAWNNRGVTLVDLKCYQEAVESYDKAIAFKPDYAEAQNNRETARKLLKKGSKKKSRQKECSQYSTRN